MVQERRGSECKRPHWVCSQEAGWRMLGTIGLPLSGQTVDVTGIQWGASHLTSHKLEARPGPAILTMTIDCHCLFGVLDFDFFFYFDNNDISNLDTMRWFVFVFVFICFGFFPLETI